MRKFRLIQTSHIRTWDFWQFNLLNQMFTVSKMTKISIATRHRVVILHEQGHSQAEIARQTGVSRCGVQAILKKQQKTGKVEDRKRSGRPRKLTKKDETYLKITSLRNRRKTSLDLAAELAQTSGKQVHSSTVRRSLIRNGLNGRVAVKKSHLRKGNKTKRFKFVQRHKNWSAEQWKSVLWSDESKFEIFGTKRLQYVRRRNGEQFKDMCLQPTIKHGGGSVQVWGCISAGGVGDLFKIDGIMNAEKYEQILSYLVVSCGRRLVGPNFIFQHEKAHC